MTLDDHETGNHSYLEMMQDIGMVGIHEESAMAFHLAILLLEMYTR